MELEIANIAAASAMRGFRYMAFPPIVFDAPATPTPARQEPDEVPVAAAAVTHPTATELAAPEVTVPLVTAPQVTTPEMTAPKMTVPGAALSKVAAALVTPAAPSLPPPSPPMAAAVPDTRSAAGVSAPRQAPLPVQHEIAAPPSAPERRLATAAQGRRFALLADVSAELHRRGPR